jgi:uncharacterized protein (DUF433 family)
MIRRFGVRIPGRYITKALVSTAARRPERPLAGTLSPVSHLHRITTDPAVCHGKPTVRGLRYPVENLLELLAAGMTIEEVIDDHPDLEREDLLAVLEFAVLASGMRRTVPLDAA